MIQTQPKLSCFGPRQLYMNIRMPELTREADNLLQSPRKCSERREMYVKKEGIKKNKTITGLSKDEEKKVLPPP